MRLDNFLKKFIKILDKIFESAYNDIRQMKRFQKSKSRMAFCFEIKLKRFQKTKKLGGPT